MREKEFLPLVASRLGIESLNDMQRAMLRDVPGAERALMLLAPTGSGKTLAFALPLLKLLNPPSGRLQAIVIAPGRELVLQIAGVLKALAPQYRILSLYGGRSVSDETASLSVSPDIVVATPGRLLDHIRRRNIEVITTRVAVLDEFDKSLSLGFESEMKDIFSHLKNLSRLILTSATPAPSLPDFLPRWTVQTFDYLDENEQLRERAKVYEADADGPDKLASLHRLLASLAGGGLGRTAVFVNHRQSAERVHDYLRKHGADSVLYHGALDQMQREKALALFRSGSRPILVTTDLGARGIDVEGVDNVVHYHMPPTSQDWTHRNGRTARAGATGSVYVLRAPQEELPQYVEIDGKYEPGAGAPLRSGLETLRIGAGRREKISRADLLGWLVKECGVPSASIGRLDVADHFSLATMPADYAKEVLARGKNQRIKGAARRIAAAD